MKHITITLTEDQAHFVANVLEENWVTTEEPASKHAFAEEGYVQAHTLPKGIYSATGKSLVQISADDPMLRATLHEWDEQGAKYIKIDGNTYYRGQEWYDRFWQIYNEDRNPQLADSSIVREQVDKIAKRAAGIA